VFTLAIKRKGVLSVEAKPLVQHHRYWMGQVCVFTNHGVSGVTSNDGKRCNIVLLKPVEEWVQGEPEYVIHFLDKKHGFGARESELEPVNSKEKCDETVRNKKCS